MGERLTTPWGDGEDLLSADLNDTFDAVANTQKPQIAFGDNCDNSNPVLTKVFVPNNTTSVDKMDLVFTRPSFRGYVRGVSATETDSPTSTMQTVIDSDKSIGPSYSIQGYIPFVTNTFEGAEIRATLYNNSGSSKTYDLEFKNETTNNTLRTYNNWSVSDNSYRDLNFTVNESEVTENDSVKIIVKQSSIETEANAIRLSFLRYSLRSLESHDHPQEYGLFEPASEDPVDVDVVVDGSTVTTVQGVSVDEEISSPIDLTGALPSDPSGKFVTIKLVPTDRCRLNANLVNDFELSS
jgi:hypothetical protein